MFFVAGRRNQTETIGRFTRLCIQCKRETLQLLVTTGTQATAFFVPLATLNKKIYLQCSVCGYGYDLSDMNAETLLANPDSLHHVVAQQPLMLIGMNTASITAAPGVPQRFYTMNAVLYVILSILTFGLLSLYWAWRNWRFLAIKQNKQYAIMWRALFFPFFLYGMAAETYAIAKEKGYEPSVPAWVPLVLYFAAMLAICFIPQGNSNPIFLLYVIASAAPVPIMTAMKFYNEK